MLTMQPPQVNGVREDLTPTQIATLKEQLERVREDFVPTHKQLVYDTFYLVVEHTKKHGEEETFVPLNGDTVEYILSYVKDDEPVEGE
jgi:hypothetical protein